MNKAEAFHIVHRQREPVPRMQLSRGNVGVPITIDAATLLGQYGTSSGDILLICDEDCVYEEQLHMVLVRDDQVIDHLVIGAPYATGHFTEVGAKDDALRFRFANERVLRLEVEKNGYRLPSRLSAGARRRGNWLGPKYLRLTTEGEDS